MAYSNSLGGPPETRFQTTKQRSSFSKAVDTDPGIVGTDTVSLSEPFPSVGKWELKHASGDPLYVNILPDGSATSDYPSNNPGRWTWEDGSLRVDWADNWVDVVKKGPDGFSKSTFKPDGEAVRGSHPVTRISSIPDVV